MTTESHTVRTHAKPGRPKGQPKTGGGSRKGIPNKITKDLRSMVLGALDDAGGQRYLKMQSLKNPQAFMTLVGRCLPKDVNIAAQAGLLELIEASLKK